MDASRRSKALLSSITKSMTNSGKQLAIDIKYPHDHDVLCGRGGASFKHVGNYTFRYLVQLNKGLYVACKKSEKKTISKNIVAAIKNQDPPGRFLELDAKTGLWREVSESRSIEKTSQALREGQAEIRKTLNQNAEKMNSSMTEAEGQTSSSIIKSSEVDPPKAFHTSINVEAKKKKSRSTKAAAPNSNSKVGPKNDKSSHPKTSVVNSVNTSPTMSHTATPPQHEPLSTVACNIITSNSSIPQHPPSSTAPYAVPTNFEPRSSTDSKNISYTVPKFVGSQQNLQREGSAQSLFSFDTDIGEGLPPELRKLSALQYQYDMPKNDDISRRRSKRLSLLLAENIDTDALEQGISYDEEKQESKEDYGRGETMRSSIHSNGRSMRSSIHSNGRSMRSSMYSYGDEEMASRKSSYSINPPTGQKFRRDYGFDKSTSSILSDFSAMSLSSSRISKQTSRRSIRFSLFSELSDLNEDAEAGAYDLAIDSHQPQSNKPVLIFDLNEMVPSKTPNIKMSKDIPTIRRASNHSSNSMSKRKCILIPGDVQGDLIKLMELD